MSGTEWMTTTEVAELLGVSRQTVSQWIRDGRLPARAIQSGARVIYRVRRTTLVDWVRRNIRDGE